MPDDHSRRHADYDGGADESQEKPPPAGAGAAALRAAEVEGVRVLCGRRGAKQLGVLDDATSPACLLSRLRFLHSRFLEKLLFDRSGGRFGGSHARRIRTKGGMQLAFVAFHDALEYLLSDFDAPLKVRSPTPPASPA